MPTRRAATATLKPLAPVNARTLGNGDAETLRDSLRSVVVGDSFDVAAALPFRGDVLGDDQNVV